MLTVTIPLTTISPVLGTVLVCAAALACLGLHAACRAAAPRPHVRPVRVRRL